VNAPERLPLPDTQSLPDGRQLAIQRVGVKELRYPVVLRGHDAEDRHTVATFAMDVGLAHDVKGTHMSRFVEILERMRDPLDLNTFRSMHARMLEHLGAASGRIEMRFPFFIRKAAPISGVESLLDYEAAWIAATDPGGRLDVIVELRTPVTSLCPCSKKISAYGAHNQRSHVTLRVHVPGGDVSLAELARIAEDEASSELYGLLKRPDEKFVTERAYDNPKFVEDLVRDIALRLTHDPRVGRFSVASENFESIHNHSAYAEIRGVGAAMTV
jgi:GTP cyclohydrolase IB